MIKRLKSQIMPNRIRDTLNETSVGIGYIPPCPGLLSCFIPSLKLINQRIRRIFSLMFCRFNENTIKIEKIRFFFNNKMSETRVLKNLENNLERLLVSDLDALASKLGVPLFGRKREKAQALARSLIGEGKTVSSPRKVEKARRKRETQTVGQYCYKDSNMCGPGETCSTGKYEIGTCVKA